MNCKKLLAIVLSLVLMVSLAACGGGSSSTAPAAPSGDSTPAPAGDVSTDDVANDPAVTLKLAFSTNEDDPRAIAAMEFKKEVEEKTGGSVTVELYPAGQLGGDAALIEALSLDSGTVDIIITDASNFATYEPRMGISALPFQFASFEEAWAFMDSDVHKEVEELLIPQNMRTLARYCNGFRCVTNSKGPIESPADMSGMLIRTPENPVIMATMRAMGANPQPLAFSELYMALQQGTYDAQENPIPVIYNNNLYEVQGYLSVTNHIYSGMCFTIGESVYQTMTDAQKAIVEEAAINSQEFNRQMNKQMTEDYIDLLIAEGVEINEPDLAPFVEATASVTAEEAASYGEELAQKLADWQASH